MAERYVVVMGAGSLREESASAMPHELIPDGISVRCEETGTHVLHLAVAGTVLGRFWRDALDAGRPLYGAQVRAEGALGQPDDESVGIDWSVAVDSGMLPEQVDELVGAIDPVADLPPELHGGVAVRRVGHA